MEINKVLTNGEATNNEEFGESRWEEIVFEVGLEGWIGVFQVKKKKSKKNTGEEITRNVRYMVHSGKAE